MNIIQKGMIDWCIPVVPKLFRANALLPLGIDPQHPLLHLFLYYRNLVMSTSKE